MLVQENLILLKSKNRCYLELLLLSRALLLLCYKTDKQVFQASALSSTYIEVLTRDVVIPGSVSVVSTLTPFFGRVGVGVKPKTEEHLADHLLIQWNAKMLV